MKNLLLISLSLIIGTTLISGILNNGGSPGRKTGSPLDGSTCAQCHSSELTEVSWISTNIPETGWIPGETYTITLSAEHESAAKIGFEITAENEEEKKGTFNITDNDRTRTLIQAKAATHKSTGNTPEDGQITWEIEWVAPESDAGDIGFYAAFNAADGNGSTSGDEIFTSSVSFIQNPESTGLNENSLPDITVYPNPVTDFITVKSRYEISEINIYTQSGKKVLSNSIMKKYENTINTEMLQKGMYVLIISTNEGDFNQKIIK
jgi:hypothetical protein